MLSMRETRVSNVVLVSVVAGLVAASCGSGTTSQPAATTAAQPAANTSAGFQCPVRGPFDDTSGYYSQFYEDYILSYVFRDQKNGTYVDVGANDPDKSSLTKYFYRAGWRGINVEPNPDMLALLNKARTEDVNVGVGISDAPGILTFYRFKSVPGISTFDRDIAMRHNKRGFAFEEMKIPVVPLEKVLDDNERTKNGFTFLNADVEGFERQVFSSIDFKKHPATVVMAEATAPETDNPTYQHWESILLSAGYIYGMDDGLNRYYVHPAHRELLPRFVEASYCIQMDKLSKHIHLNGFGEDPH
jgi:FkbM family methyltransferase